MKRIPGELDWRRLAETHRQPNFNLLRREALKLAAQGLTERDIGQALGLDPTAVRAMLAEAA